MRGHTCICRFLVGELGVQDGPKNSYGETPLYLAMKNGYADTAMYLLEHGADAFVKSNMGLTLLHQASKLGQNLLHALINKGVDIEAGACIIGSPLFFAAGSGKLEALRLLLNHKAKLNSSTDNSLSPLVAAVSAGSLPCVQALVEGADLDDLSSLLEDAIDVPNNEVYKFLSSTKEEREQAVAQKGLHKKIVSSNKYKMYQKAMSDEDIEAELHNMLADGEKIFFSNWNILQKRLFYKSTLISLKRPREVSNLNVASVKRSVDTTNVNKAQASFLRAICCYRAWHFDGTDLAYEFGEEGPRVCVSRKNDMFIFWFRYENNDVRVVINGQTLWAEGFLRRRWDEEKGEFMYNHPIEFGKEDYTKEMKGGRKMKLEKESAYIVADDLEIVDYGGNYKGSVTDLELQIFKLRAAIASVSNYMKGSSFESMCHFAADRLILYSTESGKNAWVFQYTMLSLNPGFMEIVRVPGCLNTTVIKHKKVSRRALAAIKARVGRSGDYQKDEEYQIVSGAPVRVLSQVISAYVILGRAVTFPTKLFLEDMDVQYERHIDSCLELEVEEGLIVKDTCTDEPRQEEDICTVESEEEKEEKKRKILEAKLRRGTLYDDAIHSGAHKYKG